MFVWNPKNPRRHRVPDAHFYSLGQPVCLGVPKGPQGSKGKHILKEWLESKNCSSNIFIIWLNLYSGTPWKLNQQYNSHNSWRWVRPASLRHLPEFWLLGAKVHWRGITLGSFQVSSIFWLISGVFPPPESRNLWVVLGVCREPHFNSERVESFACL